MEGQVGGIPGFASIASVSPVPLQSSSNCNCNAFGGVPTGFGGYSPSLEPQIPGQITLNMRENTAVLPPINVPDQHASLSMNTEYPGPGLEPQMNDESLDDTNIHSRRPTIQDIEMTIPMDSERRAPTVAETDPKEDNQYLDGRPSTCSNLAVKMTHQTYNAHLALHELLNNSPPRVTTKANVAPSSAIEVPHVNNTNHRTTRRTSTISMLSGYSTLCTTSTQTISTNETRYILLKDLYHTCLDATSTYIQSYLPFPTHTHLSRKHQKRNKRYHPYSHPIHLRTTYSKPATLMDNLSKISNHIWREARNDPMAPHRAEAYAVRTMRDLYVWGEMVARGLESDEVEDSESESEVMMDRGQGGRVKDTCEKVVSAARKICNFLEDEEAWDECQDVWEQLRGLGDREGRA